jgi:cysteinyl-tRNA synthetase
MTYIVNVTDIEDKIIAASQEEGRPWQEVAGQYTESYLDELRELGVRPPTAMPKATEHVESIIALVERLIESGHAYALDGGDVAFHVPGFADYGRLSLRDLDQQISGARVEADQRKKDPRDFFLWKATKLGGAVGSRAARLAHRVLGDERAVPRDGLRHPRRRDRPGVPAPRE